MILRSGHEVTDEFRRSQFVIPVAALSVVHMGVTTPWNSTGVVFSKLLSLQNRYDIPDELKQLPPPPQPPQSL